MSNPNLQKTDAWIITDPQGRIQAISSGAHEVLGLPRLGRGDHLPTRFAAVSKALLADMEVALTGWPTERTVILIEISRRPVAFSYRVSRKLPSDDNSLFWLLGRSDRDERLRCA